MIDLKLFIRIIEILRQSLIRKAYSRYPVMQFAQKLINVLFTAATIGSTNGEVLNLGTADDPAYVDKATYSFTGGLNRLINAQKIYVNGANDSFLHPYLHANMLGDDWKSVKFDLKDAKITDFYPESEKITEVKPRLIAPEEVAQFFNDLAEGWSSNATFNVGRTETFSVEKFYITDISYISDEKGNVLQIGSNPSYAPEIAYLLQHNPFSDLTATVMTEASDEYDLVGTQISKEDVVKFLFGGASSGGGHNEEKGN